MRLLNCRYRGKDYSTDVLSFIYDEAEVDGSPFLGEIVIAPAVAVEHALEYGNSAEDELRKLLVHGTLHLLGYDHETDRGQMIRLQSKLLHKRFLSTLPPLVRLREIR